MVAAPTEIVKGAAGIARRPGVVDIVARLTPNKGTWPAGRPNGNITTRALLERSAPAQAKRVPDAGARVRSCPPSPRECNRGGLLPQGRIGRRAKSPTWHGGRRRAMQGRRGRVVHVRNAPREKKLGIMRHDGSQETQRTKVYRRFAIREARSRSTTYRRLGVAEEPPVDFGKPFVLLHLGGAALAAHPRLLRLVQQPRNKVLAWPADEGKSLLASSRGADINHLRRDLGSVPEIDC